MVELMLELVLVLILIVSVAACWWLIKENRKLRFGKRSLSTKYGRMSEQFFPFMKDYPYDEQNFRFIGSPIDGVQFEDDKIVFVEFKSAGSGMSQKQRRIKELVDKKRVEFEEVRI